MSGFMGLEELMYENGVKFVFGSPEALGLAILAFFIGFVFLQQTKLETKLLILVPAGYLAGSMFPPIMLVIALVMGFVIFLAGTKLFKIG